MQRAEHGVPDEVDLTTLEEAIRSVHVDGVKWGYSTITKGLFGDKEFTIMCSVHNTLFYSPEDRLCPDETHFALESIIDHTLIHGCHFVELSEVVDTPKSFEALWAAFPGCYD